VGGAEHREGDRGHDDEPVDDAMGAVGGQDGGRARERSRPEDRHDRQRPLPAVPVREGGDHGGADRRRDHAGDRDQADAGCAPVVEGHDGQGDGERPLAGQRAQERQLGPPQLGLGQYVATGSPGRPDALPPHGRTVGPEPGPGEGAGTRSPVVEAVPEVLHHPHDVC
jgi:hypothetical protein